MIEEKVERAVEAAKKPAVILTCRMQDELPPHMAALYLVKKGKDYLKYPRAPHLLWRRFLKRGDHTEDPPSPPFDRNRTSVILYSGGTAGKPKGICLSDNNFNGHLCVHFLRDMSETKQNDPKYGVSNQETIRALWKSLTGETLTN